MGSCVEKEEIDAPAEFQPKTRQTSPYLTKPIEFLIGPQKARYTVQRAFLSESPQWSSECARDSQSWNYHHSFSHHSFSGIALPEVNEDAGHTLIHYLYTGTFQKLHSPEDDDLTADLKKNVHIYGVAVKYSLAGLKKLALEKIQNKEGSGDIFDILETIKEASRTLLEDDLGLKPYIERELKAAFESDDTFFGKERFIELFGEAKQFDRILMRIVADIYSEKIAQVSQNRPDVINGSPLEAIFTTEKSGLCSLLLEQPATEKHEEPNGYGKLYDYEKPSECGDPFDLESVVDELDISKEYPVQPPFSTLEKKSYKDLAVNKVNISKEYTDTILKQVPTLGEEKRGESAKPISELNPWDHPPPLNQDLSGVSLPVSTQGPPADGFQFGVSKEPEEIKDWNFWGLSPPRGDLVLHNETASHVEVERTFGEKSTSCEADAFLNWGEPFSRAKAVKLETLALCQEDTPAEAIFIEGAAPIEPNLPIGKDKKKSKWKKAKRSYESKIEATTVVEESFPCTEVAPSEEAAPIELDLPIGKVKKGKKGKKPRRMSFDSEIEAISVVGKPVPCTEVALGEESPPVAEETAPCTEVVPREEVAPVELALPIRKAEKKKVKNKKMSHEPEIEAAVKEDYPDTEGTPSEEKAAAPVELDLSIGKAAKKGKKGKKTKSAMPDPVPEPLSASGEIVPEIPALEETAAPIVAEEISAPIAAEEIPAPIAAEEIPAPIAAEEARTENGGVDLQQQQHPDDESSRICASRATHLLIDDEWKKCLKCRALIHHLSVELARNMNEEDQHACEII